MLCTVRTVTQVPQVPFTALWSGHCQWRLNHTKSKLGLLWMIKMTSSGSHGTTSASQDAQSGLTSGHFKTSKSLKQCSSIIHHNIVIIKCLAILSLDFMSCFRNENISMCSQCKNFDVFIILNLTHLLFLFSASPHINLSLINSQWVDRDVHCFKELSDR